MINVNDEFKEAMSNPGRILNARMIFNDFTLDGTNIVDITLNDNLLTSDSFEIGTFIATIGEGTLLASDYKFGGKEFRLEIGVQDKNNTFQYINLGLYKIENPTLKDSLINIKFFDRATKFDIPYVTKLTYPQTLLSITKEICSIVGITLKTENFPNSSKTIEIKPNFHEDMTCRQIISKIAELSASYVRISEDGQLEFFTLSKNGNNSVYAGDNTFSLNADDRLVDNRCVIGIDRNTYIDLDQSENLTQIISKVQVRTGDVRAELGDNTGATYYITDNIFCQNPLNFIADIYNILSGIEYRKIKVKWQGNPMWQTGDLLTVYDGYKFLNTYIMSKKLSFKGGLTEEYSSEGKAKDETLGASKGNLTLKVDNTIVEVKIAKDEISQRVKKDDFESYVKQTAEEISSKVTANDVETLVKQNADSWELSIKGKLVGKSYRFDETGFHLGSSDSENVVSHTNEESIFKHEDGSYTKISATGLERFVGSTKAKYHSMINLGNIDTILEPSQVSGATFTVTLPDEWKGKDFNVFCCVSDFQTANISANNRVGAWVYSYDRANAKFIIKANAEAWLLTPVGGAWGLETNFAKAKILISYIAIA